MPFQKGQSGNPGGRAREKPWRDALMLAIRERTAKDQPQNIVKIAKACIEAAIGGDTTAMKEIGDRLDGRPAPSQEESDDTRKLYEAIGLRVIDAKS